MEMVINGIKCVFGGIRDGGIVRPLNESDKRKIAIAVAKAMIKK